MRVALYLMPIFNPIPGSIIANQIRMSRLLNWKVHAHFSSALRGIKIAGEYWLHIQIESCDSDIDVQTGKKAGQENKEGSVIYFVPLKYIYIKWRRVRNYNSDYNSNRHFDFNFIILIRVII